MIEKGTRSLQVRQALKLKQEFGVPLDWLYDADGQSLPQDLRAAIFEARSQLTKK